MLRSTKNRSTAPPKINTLQQAVLDRLASVTAADAEFHPGLDEYGRRHSECLPQTREEILKDICDWLDGNTSPQKYLYWLQGKAGTGKSTIARTIVSRMARQNRIAANFFFKRGEGDRAKLKRFFTTLVAQIVRQWPSFAKAIQDALESDPSLPEQDPRIQFKKFIQEPLQKQERNKSKVIIIIVDAHDECDSSEDLTGLVQQLTQSQDGHSTQLLVKCFLTSRFDHHSQSSFNSISEEICEKKELEKATSATIKQDIERYLRAELEKIDGLLDPLPVGGLWSNPSDVKNLMKLTERACPLFEFAAFSTRFIKQKNVPGGPQGRLRYILETQIFGDLNKLYGFIIDRRFSGLDRQCRDRAEANFQKIIGSIIFLADAVTVRCLAELLKLSEAEIREELQLFESVLVVPEKQDDQSPITLFHESFRDFLSGSGTKKKLKIDHTRVHTMLASRCRQLLCGSLRENMCKLKTPGTHRSEVADETVNESIPQEVQYACRFWIFHVKRSESSVKDGDDSHLFLLSHLLHWLEAMSFLGRTSESASLPSDGVQVKAFLEDAERLILSFRHVIDVAPLQLYSSVLTFSPPKSLVRERFDAYRAKWISHISNVDSQWSPCLQTFEGHVKSIGCVNFSPDGILASADEGNIIKVWDPIAGTCLQTFSMHGQWKRGGIAMAFSKAGRLACMAAGSLSVWDIRRDVCLQTLDLMQFVQRDSWHSPGSVVFEDEQRLLLAGAGLRNVLKLQLGHECEEETNLPFHNVPTILSPDGQWVAYAIQGEIRVLNMNSKTARLAKTLEGVISYLSGLKACFSQDNRYFASAQDHGDAMIWDVSSATCLQFLSEIAPITSLTFSQDSRLLGIGLLGGSIIIWDWGKHSRLQACTGHQLSVTSLSFSLDGTWLASASNDCTVKIWDTTIQDHEEKNASPFSTNAIAMATGGQRLATISAETSGIQLLDDSGRECITQPFKKAYNNIAISANGSIFAAVSRDRTGIEIWDAESEKFLLSQTSVSESDLISSIALSANGERFIIGLKNGTAEVWESRTGRLLKELKQGRIHSQGLARVAISCDGEQFAWTRCGDGYYISPDGAWIMRNREKLLWILPEYRPRDAIVSGSKFAIERASGPPIVIKLSDEGL
ncbi:hypothetical protein CI102_12352 [Trichoderma harzianum]|nr:hypothetical protein CI102_12352 [Trichoderma harzianum]